MELKEEIKQMQRTLQHLRDRQDNIRLHHTRIT